MVTVKLATGDSVDADQVIGLRLFIIDDRFYVKALVRPKMSIIGQDSEWHLLSGNFDTKYDADQFLRTLPKVPLG